MSLSEATPERIRSHFIGWQCRIRQIAMRKDGGRPSQGMCARILLKGGEELAAGIVMLVHPRDIQESTSLFRHQVRRTHDPREIYEKVLQYLQGTHYQSARSFSDVMTASFAEGSEVAGALLEKGDCMLEFSQFKQSYRMFCAVEEAVTGAPLFEATYWHNRAFNPDLTQDVRVLAFAPDWSSAQADPMP